MAGVESRIDACIVGSHLAPVGRRYLECRANTYGRGFPEAATGSRRFFYAATDDVRPFLDHVGVEPDNWG
jgi:hypothetical protein